jgi:hypothetical protein
MSWSDHCGQRGGRGTPSSFIMRTLRSPALLLVSYLPLALACTPLPRPAQGSPALAPPDAGPHLPASDALRALGARVRPWSAGPSAQGALRCGVSDGVVLTRGPTGVRYSRPLHLEGAFALKLARFEAIVQEEAQRSFGKRVVQIDHLGTYVCRTVAGSSGASEHAYGDAIDVAAFQLAGGRKVVVQRDFVRGGATPSRPAGQFLDRILERARDERLFGTMLTPDFDVHHANHFHLDGRDWGGWWRRLFG